MNKLSLIPRTNLGNSTITSYDIPLGEYGTIDMVKLRNEVYIISVDAGLLQRIKITLGSPDDIINLEGRSRQYEGMIGFALKVPNVRFSKAGGNGLQKILLNGLAVGAASRKLLST